MNSDPNCPAIFRLAAGGLLIFHAWVVLDLIPQWSVTRNEPGHIAAGLTNWYTGTYDLYRVNPPLPRMMSTAPLLSESIICLSALALEDVQSSKRREREIGNYFANTNAVYYHELVCRARIAGVFWIVLGGILVWRWSTRIFGPLSGLLTLVLWTFDPTLTAHAALATSDVPATVMGLAATYAFAHLLRTGSLLHAFIAGLLLGVALQCKFTLLLLAPIWALAWLLTRRNHEQHDFHTMSNRSQISHLLLIVFLAWLTLNAGFEFNGTWTRVNEFDFASTFLGDISELLENSGLGGLPCPVPSAYIKGIDTQQVDFERGLRSYLRGEWRYEGWWWYLYAFGVKTPIGHLAIYGLAASMAIKYRQSIPSLIWLFPILIFAAASSKNGFTEHLRYILPAYPFIMIFSGIVLSHPLSAYRRARRLFVICSLTWSSASMSLAYPNLLGYFNQMVGGSQEGWRHLAESNVDWGQDLIFLKDWLTAHPEMTPVYTALNCYIDQQLYLRQEYPIPELSMSGYAVVDAYNLTCDYQWLLKYPIVERIGTSIFVFKVAP